MRGISVLGSTGSIGTQTLDVIRRNNDIKVVALAAGTRVDDLEKQVNQIGSDAYMEKQAREWLKMAKQGEIIYVNDDDSKNKKQEDSTEQNDTEQ